MPGAVGDHLTSFGGALEGRGGQMTALAWIASGATASYGTVSEPCAHPQKFPHPQVLLLQYVQGSTADRGLLEERRLAAAGRVHRRAAGGAVRAALTTGALQLASDRERPRATPERTAPSSVAG